MAFQNGGVSGSDSKNYSDIRKIASSFFRKSSDLRPIELVEKLKEEKREDLIRSKMSDNNECDMELPGKKGPMSFTRLLNTPVNLLNRGYQEGSAPKESEGSNVAVMDDEPAQPAKCKARRTVKRTRRCWTPELHSLFVDAIAQIGGPNAATPKHILEQMKVDGLTTDEVKSHLQKFRLHVKKFAA